MKEDVKPVKYSAEYLDHLEENILNLLEDDTEVLSKKPFVDYENTSGYTKEDCFYMCKEHDKNATEIAENPKSKTKHPLSPQQKNLNKQNQIKQKDNNTTRKDDNEHL